MEPTRSRSTASIRGTAIALALLSFACSEKEPGQQPEGAATGTAGGTAGLAAPGAGGVPATPAPAGSGAAGSSMPRAAGAGPGGAGGAGGGSSVPGRIGTAGTSAAGANAAGGGAGGTDSAEMDPGPMQPGPGALPTCESSAPENFQPNPSVGGGGSPFVDTAHFRIHGGVAGAAQMAGEALEAAYSCFVETLCWRSSGLSINSATDAEPYYKMNIYGVASLANAAGEMSSDARAGLSYLRVVNGSLGDPKVTVHEYGHALTYHEKGWIEQTRTGAWWETVANFVADTYLTSPLCAGARERHQQPEGRTIIELNRVIGDSYQVIVDATAGTGNYYQAWPFLTYLTNNPDGYAGLGPTALRDMFRKHMGNNETPLHVLERIAADASVQKIVGRYWARMAYLDIGHKQAQEAFISGRSRLNFANLDSTGGGAYRVKASRQPRYFGANIIPLHAMGTVSVRVTSSAPFTATLAVRAMSGSVKYVDLANGAGEITVGSGEEASLIVVNTPTALIQYDPFQIGADVARGLSYDVQLTGATPSQ